MPHNSRAFGNVIRRIRKEKGFSQTIVADFAQISRSHLTLLENGKKTAGLDTLWKIADALDTTPHELIELVEKETLHDH